MGCLGYPGRPQDRLGPTQLSGSGRHLRLPPPKYPASLFVERVPPMQGVHSTVLNWTIWRMLGSTSR